MVPDWMKQPKVWNAIQACVIALLTGSWGASSVMTSVPAPEPVAEVPYVSIETAEGHSLRWPADGEFTFDGDLSDLIGGKDLDVMREAHGRGMGITAVNNEAQIDMTSMAPDVDVSGASSNGGSSGFDIQTKMKNHKTIILIVMGGLVVASGIVVAVWLKAIKLGLGLAAAGGAMCAIGFYPWLLLVSVGIAALIGLFLFMDYKELRDAKKSLAVNVAAVQNMPPDQKKEHTARIKTIAGSDLKVVSDQVHKIKRRL